jgi:hypothetical protein
MKTWVWVLFNIENKESLWQKVGLFFILQLQHEVGDCVEAPTAETKHRTLFPNK